MIRLTDLAGKGSFKMGGRQFEYGKVYSNPFATAFIKEGEDDGAQSHEKEGGDHEVHMEIGRAHV